MRIKVSTRSVPLNGLYCLEEGPGRADDPLGGAPADAPLRGQGRRGRLGAGAEVGQDAGEPLVARVRVRLGGAPGCRACGRRPCPGGGRPRPRPWTASTAGRGGPGGPGRRRRARGSSRGGGWRGSRPGRSSAACGRLRRRRPGRPGRRPGRPGSATRSCPAGGPGARRSTRLRTSSPSGRSARPSPGDPSWPGRGTSRWPCVGGTPRAAMSARLITGRPLIAGIGTTSSRQPYAQAARQAASGLAPPSGRPGNLSPPAGHMTIDGKPLSSTIPASPAALDASLMGVLGRCGARRPTGPLPRRCPQCRPSGRARRPPSARPLTGDLRSTSGRGRPRPRL